jgi:hypothetical protein
LLRFHASTVASTDLSKVSLAAVDAVDSLYRSAFFIASNGFELFHRYIVLLLREGVTPLRLPRGDPAELPGTSEATLTGLRIVHEACERT